VIWHSAFNYTYQLSVCTFERLVKAVQSFEINYFVHLMKTKPTTVRQQQQQLQQHQLQQLVEKLYKTLPSILFFPVATFIVIIIFIQHSSFYTVFF